MNSDTILFFKTIAFLILCGFGFVKFLGYLGSRRSARERVRARRLAPEAAGGGASDGPDPSVPEAGVYGLRPGVTYRVVKSFADYYKGQFLEGEELVFVSRNYLPYHGGHTLIFQPRNIYLQDDESSEILHKLGQYLAPVEKG